MPFLKRRADPMSGSSAGMMDTSSIKGFGMLDGSEQQQRMQKKQMRKRNKSAWKRQIKAKREAKVVQKSAGYVDKFVAELTEGDFLSNTPNQPIARFHRSEIIAGNMLGRGVYARVYGIKDFDLHLEEEERIELELQQELQQQEQIQALGSNNNKGDHMGAISEIDEGGDNDENTNGTGNARVNWRGDSNRTDGNHGTRGTKSASTAGTSSTAAMRPTSVSKSVIASSPSCPDLRGSMMPPSQQGSMYGHLMSQSARQKSQSALRLMVRDVNRSGETRYALKHLTKSLLRNPKNFHLAAAALLVEANYLSKLNHPNIVKVGGLAMSGGPPTAETFAEQDASLTADHSRRPFATSKKGNVDAGDGSHDSYFFVTEQLTDTLDRRIRQWKRDQPSHKKLAEQSSTQKIQTWKHMMRKTSYALQITNALSYLHERRLLYRDLKPQNIGFSGDNETITLFNFGLCRELDSTTGKVHEDEVTALYGALSWKYTAVECFPQPVVQTAGDFFAVNASFLSSRSFGMESLSGSLSGILGTHTRHTKMNDITLQELERELQVVHEQFQEEQTSECGSIHSAPSQTGPGRASIKMVKETYDVKVDVYSWAMVYYELLTLNQPFSGMNQKEHLRKVAGPKGGQRPGVYQFDLTPSMISLLQRAWDQNPRKRPTMASVGRNLQLILKELEELINEEQKAMVKAASAIGGEAVAEDRKAERSKRKEARGRRKEEKRARKAAKKLAKKGSVLAKSKASITGLFSKNQYSASDVREALASPSGLFGPISNAATSAVADAAGVVTGATEAAASTVATVAGIPTSRLVDVNEAEVDIAALEYEEWSLDDDSESSSSSSPSGTMGASSAPDVLCDKEIIITPASPESKMIYIGDSQEGEEEDNVSKKRQTPNQERNLSHVSNQSGDGSGGLKRTQSNDSTGLKRSHSNDGSGLKKMRFKGKSKARRSGTENTSLERRGTNRMSRRTMRLSRASVWMMRRDFKILVTVATVVLVLALGGACVFWFQKRQATWLGVDLRVLKKGNNVSQAREILQDAITEACRHSNPREHDPNKPMLFQGGALSPVDLACMQSLGGRLDDKMVWVTGVPNKHEVPQQVGFLNIHHFAKPPPKPRRSKYRRKKAWKFFREEEDTTPTTTTGNDADIGSDTTTDAGSDVDTAGDEDSLSELAASMVEEALAVSHASREL